MGVKSFFKSLLHDFSKDAIKYVVVTLLIPALGAAAIKFIPAVNSLFFTRVTFAVGWLITVAFIGTCAIGVLANRYLHYKRRDRNAIQLADLSEESQRRYLGKAEEWESYKNDNILGVDWAWWWERTTVESLTPLCPKCGMQLYPITRPFDDSGFMPGEWLLRLECRNAGNCDWTGPDFTLDDRFETQDQLWEFIKRTIHARAREKGYDVAASSFNS